MEFIGVIIDSKTHDGISSLTIKEEMNPDKIWEFTNLKILDPVSLIINKDGQVVRIYSGNTVSSKNSLNSLWEIHIDITSQPDLSDSFNSEAFKNLRVRLIEK